MPLSKEKMREYKRKKRAEAAGKVYIPEPVNPISKPDGVDNVNPDLPCKPEKVNPKSKPVNPECKNCKKEYKRGYVAGFQACKGVPVAPISVPVASGEPKKPYKDSDFDMEQIRRDYRASHPLTICHGCKSYNRDCICPPGF